MDKDNLTEYDKKILEAFRALRENPPEPQKAKVETVTLPLKKAKPLLPVDVMIIAPNPKGIHFVKLASELIPNDCQPSFIELTNKWMYVIEEVKPGDYRLPDTKDIIIQYPETLKRGIDMPANRAYWAMSKNPLEKLAIGALIAVIAIGAILTFAMVSDKNKHQQQTTPQTISQGVTYDAGH